MICACMYIYIYTHTYHMSCLENLCPRTAKVPVRCRARRVWAVPSHQYPDRSCSPLHLASLEKSKGWWVIMGFHKWLNGEWWIYGYNQQTNAKSNMLHTSKMSTFQSFHVVLFLMRKSFEFKILFGQNSPVSACLSTCPWRLSCPCRPCPCHLSCHLANPNPAPTAKAHSITISMGALFGSYMLIILK